MRQAKAYLDEGIVIARKHHHRMRTPLFMNRADIACRERDTKSAAAWLDEARAALAEDYPAEPWRAAQLDNVALFCEAVTPAASPTCRDRGDPARDRPPLGQGSPVRARGALANPAGLCRSGQAAARAAGHR